MKKQTKRSLRSYVTIPILLGALLFIALTGVVLLLEDGLKLVSWRNAGMLVGIPGAMLERTLGVPDWVEHTAFLGTFFMFAANAILGGFIGFIVGLFQKLTNDEADAEDNNNEV
jgi:hypothetical protein